MSYDNYLQWKTHQIQGVPELSIVIPAYNEAIRILPTIGAIASYVSTQTLNWELIIADDGSTDETVQLVEELEFANIRVLRAAANGGKGSAVRRGMLAARGTYLLFADADNSTPIEELPNLLRAIQAEGHDVAVGSRAANGASEAHKSLLRRALSGGLRWMVGHLFHIPVTDTQCGFKLFTKKAAHQLYFLQTIEGFSFDLEILYLAAKLHMRIAEVPVTWIDAPGSKVDTAKEVRRFLRDLMLIRWNDFRGIYEQRLKQFQPQLPA